MKKGYMPLTLATMIQPSKQRHLRALFFSNETAALLIFGIGFAPITALALTLMSYCSLSFASLTLVVPALALAIGVSSLQRAYGKLMGQGYLMGLVAVACYDCVRISFILLGWMDDFIPKIGGMLLGDGDQHLVIGYLWRYLGNAGGMGMAFVVGFSLLKHRFRVLKMFGEMKCAIFFGVAVWSCLIVTLVLSPNGEDLMFEITFSSLLLSLIGHVVFGYTLGRLVKRHSLSLMPTGTRVLPE